MENKQCFIKNQDVDFRTWQTADLQLQLIEDEEIAEGILENVKNVMVSFEQSGIEIDKDLSSGDISLDIEKSIIYLHLSQEETGSFVPNQYVKCQVNILYNDERRTPTCQALLMVGDNIYNEEMS